MTTTELTEHYCTCAKGAAWQHELRWSVRLQLALAEPVINTRAVQAALHLVEHDLCQLLLASDPASITTPGALGTAAVVMQMSQLSLLSNQAECRVLRHELPVTEFLPALRPTCRPCSALGSGWPLAA